MAKDGTFEQARRYLQQVRILAGKYEAALLEIEELRTIAEKTVGKLAPNRVQSSKTGKENEDVMLQIVKIWDEHKEQLNLYMTFRKEVVDNIFSFVQTQHREANVLYMYYVKGYTLQMTADVYGMSKEWAIERRKRGETELQANMLKYPEKFTIFDHC